MIGIRLIFGHFESFLPKDTGCAHSSTSMYSHIGPLFDTGDSICTRGYMYERCAICSRADLAPGCPTHCTIRTASSVRDGRACLHLIRWPLSATDTSEAHSSFAIELVLEFVVGYAATLLALQVQHNRIHVVRSNRLAWKWHSRNGPWT